MPDIESSYSPAASGVGPPFRVLKMQTMIDGVPTLVDVEVVMVADKDGNLFDTAGRNPVYVMLKRMWRILERIRRETRGNRVTNAEAAVVAEQGALSIVTGQFAPTTTAIELAKSRPFRRSILLMNAGSVDVYIGPEGVTASNGFKLAPSASVSMLALCRIFGVTTSGTGAIHTLEEFD